MRKARNGMFLSENGHAALSVSQAIAKCTATTGR